MTCTVIVVDEAEAQIRAIDAWCASNNPAGKVRFLRELGRAVELLGAVPDIGHPFVRATLKGVRRLLLRRSKHFVYYVHDRPHAIVYILAVWGTSRGAEPPL